MAESFPYKIVGWVDDYNLTKVSWLEKKINAQARVFDIQEGEAVVFTNKAQDRFRIIHRKNGILRVEIPTVGQNNKLSMYLQVSLHLSALPRIIEVKDLVDQVVAEAEARIARSQARAKARKRKK